jgi:hypothetical protein
MAVSYLVWVTLSVTPDLAMTSCGHALERPVNPHGGEIEPSTAPTGWKQRDTCDEGFHDAPSMGVPGTDDQLMGDEPHMALTFRRWAEAHAHHHELRTIRKPLKLAYAVEHGWEPGLWTRGDLDGVDQGPARRRFVPAFMVRR